MRQFLIIIDFIWIKTAYKFSRYPHSRYQLNDAGYCVKLHPKLRKTTHAFSGCNPDIAFMNNNCHDPDLITAYMGYPLFSAALNAMPAKAKLVINTINQYSFCVAEQNPQFKRALQQADVLLPDGVGILAAVKLQTNQRIHKISGSDLHQFLLERLDLLRGKCFYLGSSPSTLEKINQHLKANFPNVKAGFYAPPYTVKFSAEDNLKMIEAVNDFAPDVLFVGMTAPKQEIWVDQHKANLDVATICCIGAVFDFFAGTVQRPNPFYVNNGLEWFGRLIKEPGRMWKRYLVFGPVFLFLLMKYKIQVKHI